MKRIAALLVAFTLSLAVTAPTWAVQPIKGTEGPDTKVTVPVKGTEGPDTKATVPVKDIEGPDTK